MIEKVFASASLKSPVAGRTRAKLHDDPTPKISNKNTLNSVKPKVLSVFIDKGSLKEFYKSYKGDFDSCPSPSGIAFADVKNVPGCNMKDVVYWISNESSAIFKKKFRRSLNKGDGLHVRAECPLKLNEEWFDVWKKEEVIGSKLFGGQAKKKEVTFVGLVDNGKAIAPKMK